MGKGGKRKGKLKKVEQIEVEVESSDESEDKYEGEPESEDEEWLALRSAVLKRLAEEGTMSAGRLGHRLGAKKQPVLAALFSLRRAGRVSMDGGVPPKWIVEEVDPEDLIDAPIAVKFLYDETKKKPGMKSSAAAFEDMKLICWIAVDEEDGNSVTSGILGYRLGAKRNAVTAALYKCAEEGKVKNIGKEGMQPSWVSIERPPTKAANVELPDEFRYQEKSGRSSKAAQIAEAAKQVECQNSPNKKEKDGDAQEVSPDVLRSNARSCASEDRGTKGLEVEPAVGKERDVKEQSSTGKEGRNSVIDGVAWVCVD